MQQRARAKYNSRLLSLTIPRYRLLWRCELQVIERRRRRFDWRRRFVGLLPLRPARPRMQNVARAVARQARGFASTARKGSDALMVVSDHLHLVAPTSESRSHRRLARGYRSVASILTSSLDARSTATRRTTIPRSRSSSRQRTKKSPRPLSQSTRPSTRRLPSSRCSRSRRSRTRGGPASRS